MRNLTKWFILASLVVIIGYDILAVLAGGVDATISKVIADYSADYPRIPFAAGLLCGHLWFPIRGSHEKD